MSLRSFFRRRQWDEERARELEAYLEIETAENIARGMASEDARAAAHRKLGNATLVREEIYRMNSLGFLETLWHDIRYGARMLRKTPGFTIVAVLTLSLGIGANTAIFSIVDWMMFQRLPIHDPQAIHYLGYALSGSQRNDPQFSYREFREIQEQGSNEFDGLSAFAFGGAAGNQIGPDGLTWQGKTLPLQSFFVTGNFFSTLGIQPELGRFFAADEGSRANADPVVVLAHDLWQSRFQGDREIIGKSVAINGHGFTVIGVAPKGFFGISPVIHVEAYLPLGMMPVEAGTPENFLTAADVRPLMVIARLKQGPQSGQAMAALKIIGQHLLSQNPRPDEKPTTLGAVPLRPPAIMNGDGPNPAVVFAFMMLTLGALVLALTCMNVVNLLLVRTTIRQGEMAVRASLGAGRGRLVRQILTESLLLSTIGCLGGITVGLLGTRVLRLVSNRIQSILTINFDLHFNWLVFTYAFTVALLAGMLVGIVPAFRTARVNLNQVLRESGRTATRRQRLRNIMVAGQVAGSLALLTVAGLFARSLQMAEHADLGFDPHNVLNITLGTNQIGYSQARGEDFYRQLLERVRALPEVESASLAALVPMGDTQVGGPITVPGFEAVKGQPRPGAIYNAVSPGYLQTMRIQLLQGRDLAESDGGKAAHVAVINETMARKYWKGTDPVGRQFTEEDNPKTPILIVGVMRDSRSLDTYSTIEPTYYIPLEQHYFPTQTLQIRTRGAAPSLTHEALAVVDSLAPTMPVFGIRSMTQALDSLNGLFGFRLVAWMSGILGLLGLALAMIGVYGVMSYSVSQRTHEIGVRMALGAQRGRILRTVGIQGLRVVVSGVAVGLVVAALISQVVKDLVIGISAMDAITYVSVSVLLASAAMIACYIPARRATRVNPMLALRNE